MEEDIRRDNSEYESEVIEESEIKLHRTNSDNKYDNYELDNEEIEAKKGNTLVYISYGYSYYPTEDFDDAYGLMDEYKMISKGEKFEKPDDCEVYMVYSADLSPETNRKLLVSNLNVDSYFISKHIEDMAKCLGGLEGLKQLIEELYAREQEFDDCIAMTIEKCLDEIERKYQSVENKKEENKKEETLDFKYSVVEWGYDSYSDDPDEHYSVIYNTKDYNEAMEKCNQNVPPEYLCPSKTFVIKKLERGVLHITESTNEKIPKHGDMRPLSEEEKEFIKTIDKTYNSSTDEACDIMLERFGPSSDMDYFGWGDWSGYERLDENDILVVYDVVTGEAMTTTSKKFMDKEKDFEDQVVGLASSKADLEEKNREAEDLLKVYQEQEQSKDEKNENGSQSIGEE